MKLRADFKLCSVGRVFDANHPTCRTCKVGCGMKSSADLNAIGEKHGLAAKTPKYRNQKVTVDGITFDSKKEASRYVQLKMMEQAGQISNLTLQRGFDLAPPVTIQGRKKPALRYKADFVYHEKGELVVEDCKGMRTDVYKIKRHLMMSVHGIAIKET